MKVQLLSAVLLLSIPLVSSLRIGRRIYDIARREAEIGSEVVGLSLKERFDETGTNYLEKRRGGGGGSRGSNGGSSGGSSSSSSSSGSSGSSVSGSGGSSAGSRNTGTARWVLRCMYRSKFWHHGSSSSLIGPSYGGGRYYGGGATSAYRSGARSPLGLAPYALAGAGLAIFPGLWLYGAYAYNFHHPYYFHNASNTTDSRNNESLPVTCLCQQYSACGCDDNGNTTYIDSLLGDGDPAHQNSSLVHAGDVNGTKTVVINGTLPNGTDTTSDNTSGAVRRRVIETSGFWVVAAIVGAMVLT